MSHVEATIHCQDLSCQTGNPEINQFCVRCGTLLPKRYLWAVGERADLFAMGQLLHDRYLVKAPHLLLDTKPGYLPDFSEEPGDQVLPYLRLIPHRPRIPEVYGMLPQASGEPIVLLEKIPLDRTAPAERLTLLPTLQTVWATASAMRQLHWLWQIAQLWQPCRGEEVATSLLTPDLLRIEGELVRLLALTPDPTDSPSLVQLGQSWQPLVASTQTVIQEFVYRLAQALIQGEVYTSEHLIAYLDGGLRYVGQQQTYQLDVATLSDRGPSRKRNEDACHPPSGTVFSKTWHEASPGQPNYAETANSSATTRPISEAAWAIVCDGIGGHQGGDVASNLAVTTIQDQLEALVLKAETWNVDQLLTYLENAAYLANDRISQRNDQDQKTDFQRMGTTLLSIIAQAHELYLTHVGDSRAYRITPAGCHQMMVDDDVASREVRLGYSFYRQASQHHSSGVLVQAIGTNSSSLLYPNVQRFILDEDCVWLLCSDGLSDNDLVDACWQDELLPLLTGSTSLQTAAERLVMTANYQNGHDNVTVALLKIRIQPPQEMAPLPQSLIEFFLSPQFTQEISASASIQPSPSSNLKTQIVPPSRQPSRSWLPFLVVLGLVAGSAYLLTPILRNRIISQQDNPSSPTSSPSSASPPPDSNEPTLSPVPPASPATIAISSLVQTTAEIVLFAQIQATPPTVTNLTNSNSAVQTIPSGSTLKVLKIQQISPQEGNWLQLEVCVIGTHSNPQSLALLKGHRGWVREHQLANNAKLLPASTQLEPGTCDQ